ncbi:hypothetical protein KGF54_000190 [Candida jiufengensis]|uniref:uncharacterized protein n=1 Tax=Candida jiufengensis TaxID=497108 RepID=UPI002225705B|nr:uncharacterized protein KGF54_000190 [Candida jiufengensis]KAI5957262.1 hypothetical protein KGF54_000190 [Candida jiufengensis]
MDSESDEDLKTKIHELSLELEKRSLKNYQNYQDRISSTLNSAGETEVDHEEDHEEDFDEVETLGSEDDDVVARLVNSKNIMLSYQLIKKDISNYYKYVPIPRDTDIETWKNYINILFNHYPNLMDADKKIHYLYSAKSNQYKEIKEAIKAAFIDHLEKLETDKNLYKMFKVSGLENTSLDGFIEYLNGRSVLSYAQDIKRYFDLKIEFFSKPHSYNQIINFHNNFQKNTKLNKFMNKLDEVHFHLYKSLQNDLTNKRKYLQLLSDLLHKSICNQDSGKSFSIPGIKYFTCINSDILPSNDSCLTFSNNSSNSSNSSVDFNFLLQNVNNNNNKSNHSSYSNRARTNHSQSTSAPRGRPSIPLQITDSYLKKRQNESSVFSSTTNNAYSKRVRR